MTIKNILTCAVAAAVSTAGAQELSTTAAEQTALHVTIYNSNIALIKDQRQLTLPTGTNTLAFKDVSAAIKPQTAILSGGVTLLEQNFEYDLLTPQTLLDKFVGKQVTLERRENDATIIREEATVLANNNGTVLKVGEQILTGFGGNNLIFNDVPADLRDRPTLTMLIDNQVTDAQQVELTYLSDGLSWSADYVAALVDEKTLNLTGWVTLNNHSGTSYNNANLQLVAGEVNRAPENRYDGLTQRARPMMKAGAAPAVDMAEESLFEYHLYTLGRPTTIKDKQQKQVSLLQTSDVPYVKRLLITAGWRAWQAAGSEYVDLTTEAKIVIDNKKDKNLGMPLPAGVIRTYQNDSKGNQQFIGEDRIKHTPENESVTLKLGESFDVTAKRKQTDFKQQRTAKQNAVSTIQQTLITASYEVVFKNAKDSDVAVEYVDIFQGNWKIKEQSLNSEKRSSTRNRWIVSVPAKGEVVLTYTVEMVF